MREEFLLRFYQEEKSPERKLRGARVKTGRGGAVGARFWTRHWSWLYQRVPRTE